MSISRLVWFSLLSVFALAGCVREEEALTDNGSDPIGGGNPPAPPPPPPPPTALAITPPADMQTEATGPATAVSLGQASASGGDGNYTYSNDAPAGGFTLGATVVTWTVTDGASAQASGTQSVTVSDTTPPTLTRPDDMQVESTGAMTMVNIGTATAVDLVDAAPTVDNDMPAAGFPMGATAVTWTATDASGNSVNAVQMVTVTAPSSGPLNITAPANVAVEATAALTNVTLGAAMASGGTAPITLSNDAPANGFPLGATVVTWTATDAVNATATATQNVTVSDTTAPSLTVPGNLTASQDPGLGNTMVDLGAATATDAVDANPAISNDAPAGGFPVGNTVVTWTASDASGNTSTGVQTVQITAFVAENCDDLVADFQTVVFPIMNQANPQVCESCHTGSAPLPTPNGFAFPNNPPTAADFEVFRTVANIDSNGQSLVLAKAIGLAGHAGGNRFPDAANDPDYATFENFVGRAQACVTNSGSTSEVSLGTGYEQLHKVVGVLGGRTPTSDESNLVAAAGTDQAAIDQSLAAVIDGLVNEDAFYERVTEIYNDLLLTDKDADDRGSVDDNFDLDAFANRDYFEGFSNNGGLRNDLRERANYGFARAPLELIKYVIRNDRPFTEVMTADYMMVNPYSADLLGTNAGDAGFPFSATENMNNHDRDDFRPIQGLTQQNGDSVPLAGVIGTHAFLARYPSTNTNVNRKRARFVFDYFLGIDIEGLAARDGLDLDNVIGNVPTYEDPQCTVCHDVMDPIAGLFTMRDNDGEYDDDNRYEYTRTTNGVPRMVPAGFSMDPADALPGANEFNPLVFLGAKLAADDRFADKTVRTVLKGLTGIDASSPGSIAFVNETKTRFVGSNYNFKALVKDIVMSDYFRATNLALTEAPADYPDVGSGRLLTPEELARKISAVTGGAYEWRGPNSNSGLNGRHYMLYGGIDSDEVIQRTTSPTALIDGIQERIANQVACDRVADDLYNDGLLFPNVDETTVPAGGEADIRQNMAFLHRHLLGEDLATDSAEIDATYQLFLDAQALGETAIPNPCRSNGQANDGNQTVLPWMAVVTYLLSDYRFLYD